ncbi:MAG: hypothetical protein AAF216_14645, partial [Pseudomonadota bacterium]
DYTLRDGVNEVELILSRPDRCALILPEVDVLTEIGQQTQWAGPGRYEGWPGCDAGGTESF